MNDELRIDLQNIRGTDSNSLLRFYDQARSVCNSSASEQERTRLEKTIQRVAKELLKRKVSF